MAGVREFRRDDLAVVGVLYEEIIRSGMRTPPPELGGYVERTLLEPTWATPEVSSLVHEADDGETLGFTASYPLRLVVEGRPARALVSGSLVVSPRAAGAGALLTRKQLCGVQELALTDGANDATLGLWPALDGQPMLHRAVEAHRTLRPGSEAGVVLTGHGHPPSVQRIGGAEMGPRLHATAGRP
ncbi:hypothetical protein [Actinomycetospora termitidis]|uniref:Uncharacterized protein n=1 Tax=Actinomycetospora termitidis TaxID=3053470 RepID=A0ABT7ME88_9PSEU|nr:hypothetical protein [Actinomycetospora sp. Odt1-22]MDL5158979.1 hypothetical protein [Actinomycetospora sp. Odt1-22]